MAMNTKKSKILITGSNGLLGQKLVELLSRKDEVELFATARGRNRLKSGNYLYYRMDITNDEQVNEIFDAVNPDIVIHTAAMTNVDECEQNHQEAYKANVEAVEHIISACEKHNTFLVHVSTDFIFNGEKGPLTEEEEPQPVNYYGETKLISEEKVKESNLDWAIARTVLVYGIAQDMSRSNIILWVKNSLEEGKEIQVVDDQHRTPTLAEDLAMGCWLIAINKAQGVYNISGKDMLTPYEMAEQAAEIFNLDTSTMSKADSTIFKQPAKRPPKTGFVIEKAEKELGYQPHSFRQGLLVLKKQLLEVQQF